MPTVSARVTDDDEAELEAVAELLAAPTARYGAYLVAFAVWMAWFVLTAVERVHDQVGVLVAERFGDASERVSVADADVTRDDVE